MRSFVRIEESETTMVVRMFDLQSRRSGADLTAKKSVVVLRPKRKKKVDQRVPYGVCGGDDDYDDDDDEEEPVALTECNKLCIFTIRILHIS